MKRMVFFCALACGRLNGDDTTSGGPVTLDQFPTAAAHAICTKMFACCDATERAKLTPMTGPSSGTEADCEAAYQSALAGILVPDINTSIADGSAAYDPDAAGVCLSVLANDSCPAFGSALADNPSSASFGCTPFLIPQVQVSAPCTQGYECTTGNCENNVCQPVPGIGSACVGLCQPNLFCGFDPMSAQELCQPLKPDTASCGSDAECQSTHCIGSGSSGGSGSGSCEPGPALCDGM